MEIRRNLISGCEWHHTYSSVPLSALATCVSDTSWPHVAHVHAVISASSPVPSVFPCLLKVFHRLLSYSVSFSPQWSSSSAGIIREAQAIKVSLSPVPDYQPSHCVDGLRTQRLTPVTCRESWSSTVPNELLCDPATVVKLMSFMMSFMNEFCEDTFGKDNERGPQEAQYAAYEHQCPPMSSGKPKIRWTIWRLLLRRPLHQALSSFLTMSCKGSKRQTTATTKIRALPSLIC